MTNAIDEESPYVEVVNGGRGVFDSIYRSDSWTLGSGPGSIASINSPLLKFLASFIRQNQLTKFADFGCGDWQFMKKADLSGITYLGLDVVESVLTQNTSTYGSLNVKFMRTPTDLSDLPEGDIILLKDVLIHLSNTYVGELLYWARKKYRFILAVGNYCVEKNDYNGDIECGGFRPVDLSLPPFSIPCATIMRYGTARVLDPRLPRTLAILRRRFVWPGVKHVQLAFGEFV